MATLVHIQRRLLRTRIHPGGTATHEWVVSPTVLVGPATSSERAQISLVVRGYSGAIAGQRPATPLVFPLPDKGIRSAVLIMRFAFAHIINTPVNTLRSIFAGRTFCNALWCFLDFLVALLLGVACTIVWIHGHDIKRLAETLNIPAAGWLVREQAVAELIR